MVRGGGGGGCGLAAWQRQRDSARRAQELLRLGQVGRLNALGELAAGMAHELNQPLTAVLASTQAAQRLLDDPDDTGRRPRHHAAHARRWRKACSRRAAPPTWWPGCAGWCSPPTAAPRGRCGWPTPCDSVLYLLAPQIEAAGVHVERHGLDDAPEVLVDPVALEQIVHNLVQQRAAGVGGGGRGAAPARDRRLGDGRPRACSACATAGRAFAPAALERAFEPFFTTRQGGLGLGLSLCESLAAGMGGALVARNAAAGGAELSLTLPRAAPPAAGRRMNQTPLSTWWTTTPPCATAWRC